MSVQGELRFMTTLILSKPWAIALGCLRQTTVELKVWNSDFQLVRAMRSMMQAKWMNDFKAWLPIFSRSTIPSRSPYNSELSSVVASDEFGVGLFPWSFLCFYLTHIYHDTQVFRRRACMISLWDGRWCHKILNWLTTPGIQACASFTAAYHHCIPHTKLTLLAKRRAVW